MPRLWRELQARVQFDGTLPWFCRDSTFAAHVDAIVIGSNNIRGFFTISHIPTIATNSDNRAKRKTQNGFVKFVSVAQTNAEIMACSVLP